MVIRSGNMTLVDGGVLESKTQVDKSMHTAEAMPVTKLSGDTANSARYPW